MQIIGWLILGVVVLGVIYAFAVRPWHLRMGSTKDEVQRSLPGDDLVPNPKFVWNQAITINAPAAEVWPWLVQIGNQRAGWYSGMPFIASWVSPGRWTIRVDLPTGSSPNFKTLRLGMKSA